jgi:hypothetical protein
MTRGALADTEARPDFGLLRWSMDVRVECYAGYRAEETPRRLLLGGRSVESVEVLARWQTPQARGFRLRGADGVLYVLVQDDASGRWTAEPSR